ncbi:unnamed protein product [Kuraishia capsulata CBS 1993]|uniref:tRNA-dihydrouridine(47) synthase [NAD(P)(+)] n=1 Tax=Kuraishia capsulata CBS 1993 TaxID=1382522 RepID=W6MG48_9ASCO|nr:uncharacterized protein KUCA_T00000667001 [Kuraishia capsulata CBS 1993]CDK24701.1 unnamed protein product [Kuraishia capsulata CBS 1993]
MVEETKRRNSEAETDELAAKRAKADAEYRKGVAPIKAEYLIKTPVPTTLTYNDDEAESNGRSTEDGESNKGKGKGKNKKGRGQNKNRELKQDHEEVRLCPALADPDHPKECRFGPEKCRFVHDVGTYLSSKPVDISGICPAFEAIGYCPAGLKCRWLSSHYDKDANRLITNPEQISVYGETGGEANHISMDSRTQLQKKKYIFDLAEQYIPYLDSIVATVKEKSAERDEAEDVNEKREETKEKVAEFIEAPFKAAEKKKLNLKGAKIVSPLTTVGNLPFRRLMRTLGADITYSEMAMGMPLVNGAKSEWALPKAHKSEYPGFGVQIATSRHWQGAKAAEAISKLTTHVSELNLNCGCPIDLLFRQGQGSALMDQPARLLRILKGMNACSGDIPVTVKIRMGTKDNHPTAENLIKRLVAEGDVGAITLHGRSRQQRYTKEADWTYISQMGSVVKEANVLYDEQKDVRDRDPVYLIGNGDCFSFEDWNKAMADPGIDSVMVARGALIKPWIFQEIEAQQYLDISATERLSILEKYAKFAVEHWGSDEFGINSARRFLCEFLSFTHRYIPVGILERLPPKLNERPMPWKGRNELETLLASTNFEDWIKITEMFLGPTGPGFSFTPKHKSNSYEAART